MSFLPKFMKRPWDKIKFFLQIYYCYAKLPALLKNKSWEVVVLPNIKSSVKSIKKDAKRHMRNVFEKNRFKKAQKLVLAAIENKDIEEAKRLLPAAYKAIDQAAANNTIHKNNAARKKSKLALKLNAISA